MAPRSSISRRAAGVVLAARTASTRETPQRSVTLCSASGMVRTEPARVPSASRGGPGAAPATGAAVGVRVDTASVTSATAAGPLARKARATKPAWVWIRSAMTDTVSRSSVSAAPRSPGARWCSGPMALPRCVTRRAPAAAASVATSALHAEWPSDTTTPRPLSAASASSAPGSSGAIVHDPDDRCRARRATPDLSRRRCRARTVADGRRPRPGTAPRDARRRCRAGHRAGGRRPGSRRPATRRARRRGPTPGSGTTW